MKAGLRNVVSFVAIALTVAACKQVPDYVIAPNEMAELMADVRMADAVIEVNKNDYNTEDKKQALKDAVLQRHGISNEQFDTSLVWYGKNIGVYQEVTQKSIDILEKRQKKAAAIAAGEAAMSVSGDSVDIWDKAEFIVINTYSPSHYVVFDYEEDPNWQRGDVYTFRTRLITPVENAKWNLTAFYDDGAIETITSNIAQDSPLRQDLTLVTDSTRTAVRISGWMNIEPISGRPAIADSISLMRRRTSPELARTRKYNQKLIETANETTQPVDEPADSATETTDRPAATKVDNRKRLEVRRSTVREISND